MPRSSALRERTVRFKTIEPQGLTDRELLEAAVHGVNKVHECVDSFRQEQEGVNRHVTDSIGALTARHEMMDGRLSTLAKAFGSEELAPGEKRPKLRVFPHWQDIATIFMSVSGAVLAYKVVEPLLEPIFRAIHAAIMAAP